MSIVEQGTSDEAKSTSDSVEAVLRAQDWRSISVRLTKVAFTMTRKRSWQLAEDLAQESIAQIFDPAYKRWDPTKESVFDHLVSTLQGLVSNRRQKRAVQNEGSFEHRTLDRFAERRGMAAPSPETEYALAEHADKQAAMLRAWAEKDEVAHAIVDLAANGVEAPAEQVTRSGYSIQEIRKARRRITDRLAAIARILDGEDDR